MDLADSTPKPHEPKMPTLSNGVMKRHAPLRCNVVTYKECLKNHAASLGGHALDGCGEYMPSPTSTPADPTSLKCAACGCHRNFHRRDPEEPPLPAPNAVPQLPLPSGDGCSSPSDSPSPPPISSSYFPSAPHILITSPPVTGSSNRKRFRTRFTQEQKERMMEFAERLGWRMQKRDEGMIVDFCREIGVEKGVFKVWMHNNKTTNCSKKEPNTTNANGASSAAATDHHHNQNSADELQIMNHHNLPD